MTKQPPLIVRRLELTNICDVCNRPRSSGLNRVKHVRCSKIRQKRYQS